MVMRNEVIAEKHEQYGENAAYYSIIYLGIITVGVLLADRSEKYYRGICGENKVKLFCLYLIRVLQCPQSMTHSYNGFTLLENLGKK